MTILIVGCKSAPQDASLSDTSLPPALINAKRAFASGDLYLAKKQTDLFLKDNPLSTEGQHLMAEILNEEISIHKEAFEEKENEEPSQDDQKDKIKTWLERSRSLLELGDYDEAARAAENVFTYDAQNLEASKILDQIRQRAWNAGKKEIMDGSETVKAEVDDRAMIYRKQARSYLASGQFGAAQMSIQKLLLLYPEDAEGLKISDQIKSQKQQTAKAIHS